MSLEVLCELQEQIETIMKVNIDLLEQNKKQEQQIVALEKKIKEFQEFIKLFDIETKIDNDSNKVSLLYLRGWFAYYNLNGNDIVYNLDARRITNPDDFEYREYKTSGGILADDVGLGKTFSMSYVSKTFLVFSIFL